MIPNNSKLQKLRFKFNVPCYQNGEVAYITPQGKWLLGRIINAYGDKIKLKFKDRYSVKLLPNHKRLIYMTTKGLI